MKTCKYCKEKKALREYPAHPYFKDGLDSRCKSCMNYHQKIQRRNRKYAIESGMLYEGVPCSICDMTTTMEKDAPNKDKAVVDHCHKTDGIRGILCKNCNTALGKFGDSAPLLERALAYLRKE